MKVVIPAEQWFGSVGSDDRMVSTEAVVEAGREILSAVYCCFLESLGWAERWPFETHSMQHQNEAELLRKWLRGLVRDPTGSECEPVYFAVNRDQLELMRMAVVDTLRGLDGWEGELHARTGLFVADGEALVEQIAVIEAQLTSSEGT